MSKLAIQIDRAMQMVVILPIRGRNGYMMAIYLRIYKNAIDTHITFFFLPPTCIINNIYKPLCTHTHTRLNYSSSILYEQRKVRYTRMVEDHPSSGRRISAVALIRADGRKWPEQRKGERKLIDNETEREREGL